MKNFIFIDFLINLVPLFADLNLIEGSEIDKEEQSERGSSSASSACLVGTTTQGLDSPPPKKGRHSDLKDKAGDFGYFCDC